MKRTSEKFFDLDALKRICAAREQDFETMYDMTRVECAQPKPNNFYLFRDHGSDILAVAHLDTVGPHHEREARLLETADGPVVYSRALDDRLGAYVLAEMLPSMGLQFDLLLTVGEEDGQSTAAFFDPADHHDRDYNWIIEFDRGGTDVVLYQYENDDLVERVEATGARVEQGIFSDISYMDHVGVKAMNWGVGYRDYHGPRAHVWLDDMFRMVDHFLLFHERNAEVVLPHEPGSGDPWWSRYGSAGSDGCGLCEESRSDPYGCSGKESTYEGWVLCEAHAAWYEFTESDASMT